MLGGLKATSIQEQAKKLNERIDRVYGAVPIEDMEQIEEEEVRPQEVRP